MKNGWSCTARENHFEMSDKILADGVDLLE
jgi:hypothetical protein